MATHKDGSPGVSHCVNYETRDACPHCNVYDASQSIEAACVNLRSLEAFSSEAEPIGKDLKAIYHRASRIVFTRGIK